MPIGVSSEDGKIIKQAFNLIGLKISLLIDKQQKNTERFHDRNFL